jgi:hypothetical protein
LKSIEMANIAGVKNAPEAKAAPLPQPCQAIWGNNKELPVRNEIAAARNRKMTTVRTATGIGAGGLPLRALSVSGMVTNASQTNQNYRANPTSGMAA